MADTKNIFLDAYVEYKDSNGFSYTSDTSALQLQLTEIYRVEMGKDTISSIYSGEGKTITRTLKNTGTEPAYVKLALSKKTLDNGNTLLWTTEDYIRAVTVYEDTDGLQGLNVTTDKIILNTRALININNVDGSTIENKGIATTSYIKLLPQETKVVFYIISATPNLKNPIDLRVLTQGDVYDQKGKFITNIIDTTPNNGGDTDSKTNEDIVNILPERETIDIYYQASNTPPILQDVSTNKQEYKAGSFYTENLAKLHTGATSYTFELIVENDQSTPQNLKFHTYFDERSAKYPVEKGWDIAYYIKGETPAPVGEDSFIAILPKKGINSRKKIIVRVTPPTADFTPVPIDLSLTHPLYLNMNKKEDTVFEQGIFFEVSSTINPKITDKVLIGFEPIKKKELTITPALTEVLTLKNTPIFTPVPYSIKNGGNTKLVFALDMESSDNINSQGWKLKLIDGKFDYTSLSEGSPYHFFLDSSRIFTGLASGSDGKITLSPGEQMKFNAVMTAAPTGNIKAGDQKKQLISAHIVDNNQILLSVPTLYKIVEPEMTVDNTAFDDQNCNGRLDSEDNGIDKNIQIKRTSGKCIIIKTIVKNITQTQFLPRDVFMEATLPEGVEYIPNSLSYCINNRASCTNPTFINESNINSPAEYQIADRLIFFDISKISGKDPHMSIEKGLTIDAYYAVRFN